MKRAADAPDSAGVRNYAIVTIAYWLFTLTDGALRMLVLLELHARGHSPLDIAGFFLFYELFGVVTNLYGGWLGARAGLRVPLVVGLSLQVLALTGLGLAARVDRLDVLVVLVAQAISGVAKDLTKMSSKSYIKHVVAPGDQRGLMRWVAWLTGSKNALKGAGFFLGGALLSVLGMSGACLSMATVLAFAVSMSAFLLPRLAGRDPGRPGAIFSQSAEINWLALARAFLFASRDAWFVLALPLTLGTALGWSHAEVGLALASWIILYGGVQAATPSMLGLSRSDGRQPLGRSLRGLAWAAFALVVPLVGMAIGLQWRGPVAIVLAVGLLVFAAVFAANSALHSYLIVALAGRKSVAKSVGFYYSANALGRLVGTVLSGALYQWAGQGLSGLLACFAGALGLVLAAGLASWPLRSFVPNEGDSNRAAAQGSPS